MVNFMERKTSWKLPRSLNQMSRVKPEWLWYFSFACVTERRMEREVCIGDSDRQLWGSLAVEKEAISFELEGARVSRFLRLWFGLNFFKVFRRSTWVFMPHIPRESPHPSPTQQKNEKKKQKKRYVKDSVSIQKIPIEKEKILR